MMTTMYGIPNCDTIKKASRWLQNHNIDFIFHDYKTLGVDRSILETAIRQSGVDAIVNKRGTTYRKLPEEMKSSMNDSNVICLLEEYPSMIKRPLLLHKEQLIVGFSEDSYSEVFGVK